MNSWKGRSSFYVNKFNGPSTVILWIEVILFAMLYGVAFRSWMVFGIIFLGSVVLMRVPKRSVYIIIALSCLWAFIAFSIGHSISLGWASGLGIVVLVLGIGAHLTGLKQLLISTIDTANHDNAEWKRGGYKGLQNFN